MDVMKPIASNEIPTGNEWLYEVKYDGFRCVLHWEENDEITLVSKNQKDLTPQFPEIVFFCQQHENLVQELLPVKLDCELAVLNNRYQANFSWIQKRGRLKNADSIQKASVNRPATLLAFDILQYSGTSTARKTFAERKKILESFCSLMEITDEKWKKLGFIQAYKNPDELWKIIFDHKGEGMIAKRKKSSYSTGKKHRDWYKIKNWRVIHGFLTAYDSKNDYFDVQVFDGDSIYAVGKCKHGLASDDFQTVKQLFLANGEKVGVFYRLPPAICASVHTLDRYMGELREPEFDRIAPELTPAECTVERLELDFSMLPTKIEFANTDKLYWPEVSFTKGKFLTYMREIAPYMLPFLQNRALTIIRCPDGVKAESFFQKHLPAYAPDFINGIGTGEEKLMVCDTLESLMWFANHGALEYHVPFQSLTSNKPIEIVFDLDPPNRDKFSWAIQAALLIKQLLDDLGLVSFVKTSGNKGLQVHIPISEGSMTYSDTAIFTQAIAWTIEKQHPNIFTTERMKEKREGRLYIDYVQHGKDKTLISPYSTRKTPDGTVATPLYWEEVTAELRPEAFTIENVVKRVQDVGCPFHGYFDYGRNQTLDRIMGLIQ
jgi:bifunctional non-homologous end joining protein LigD